MANVKCEVSTYSRHLSPDQQLNCDVDEGLQYLQHHHGHIATDEATLKAIRLKVDWRIFPIILTSLLFLSLDKFALNYAAVMGLRQDLSLVGNDFTNVATAFFVAYVITEIPNVYMLQRIPPAKWYGINIIFWGLTTACCAGATSFSTLLTARIFLGVFEATSYPSVNMITAQWYTKSEAAPRYGLWSLGTGGAMIIGGLISYGFQHMTSSTLSGWRTMFLVLGILTILVGIAIIWKVPDTPVRADFLNENEKISLLKHVSVNKVGLRNSRFKVSEIWEAAGDLQIWIFSLAAVCLSEPSGIIASYSATLIRNMGFTPKRAALLNMPSGATSILITLCCGHAIRRTPGHHRWFWISSCALLGTVGAGLMSFLSPSNHAGLLIGIWLVNAITATLPMMFLYVSGNVSGHTKRSLASNMVGICFGLGNIAGPQSFQAHDAPEYKKAKIEAMTCMATVAVLMWLLVLYYIWENRRRDGRERENMTPSGREDMEENEVWAGLTDRKNKSWRYVY